MHRDPRSEEPITIANRKKVAIRADFLFSVSPQWLRGGVGAGEPKLGAARGFECGSNLPLRNKSTTVWAWYREVIQRWSGRDPGSALRDDPTVVRGATVWSDSYTSPFLRDDPDRSGAVNWVKWHGRNHETKSRAKSPAYMSENDAPPCGPQILEMQRAPFRAPSPHEQPHSPARLPIGELRSPLAFTFPLLRAPQHV